MQRTQKEPGTLKPLKNEEISKARGVSGADTERETRDQRWERNGHGHQRGLQGKRGLQKREEGSGRSKRSLRTNLNHVLGAAVCPKPPAQSCGCPLDHAPRSS